MKKILLGFLFLCAVSVTMTSCFTDEDKMRLHKECMELSTKKGQCYREIESLRGQIATLNKEVSDLQKERGLLKNGREPQYLVKFKIKQGTFTLDPFEHIKNEANSIEMEIPVSREFYNRVSIGTDITDKFKAGSFWIDGDFSWLHMKVISKRVN